MSLAGKRLLITGVVNTESIAFAVARRAINDGARVVLTAFPRDRELTESAASVLGADLPIFDLDASDPSQYEPLERAVREELGGLDGALHAIAFAPSDALAGELAAARPEGVELAFRTSAFSLAPLAAMTERLAGPQGASVAALGFASERAWPVYNWMGVCKAALDSTARYLARDLGPSGVRVNVVAAGPLRTRAAGGIPGFDQLLSAWERSAPLRWDPEDPEPVADAVAFLLSDQARAISGEVINVDGGYHSVAAPARA
jgi:enoyl-[acyl-carrier protein] reductase I